MFQKRKFTTVKKTIKRLRQSGGDKFKLRPFGLPSTSRLGGDEAVHLIRRGLPDVTMFGNGATITAANADGLAITWLSLGTQSADLASAPLLVQFGASINFQLAQIINAVELQNMFNEYQVVKMSVRMTLDCADAWTQGGGGNPSSLPSVYVAFDPNDSTPPPNTGTILQHGDARQYEFIHDRPITLTFYPRSAQQVYNTAMVGQGYAYPASNSSFWYDTAAPSDVIPFYGLKLRFRNVSAVNAGGLAIRIQPTVLLRVRRFR